MVIVFTLGYKNVIIYIDSLQPESELEVILPTKSTLKHASANKVSLAYIAKTLHEIKGSLTLSPTIAPYDAQGLKNRINSTAARKSSV